MRFPQRQAGMLSVSCSPHHVSQACLEDLLFLIIDIFITKELKTKKSRQKFKMAAMSLLLQAENIRRAQSHVQRSFNIPHLKASQVLGRRNTGMRTLP